MSSKTDLKLSSTSAGGDPITTTISDVNPAASNLTLKTFAQKLNMLTTNTYEETNKVTTVNIDSEPEPEPEKPQATLKLTTYSGDDVQDTLTAGSQFKYVINTNTTATVYFNFEPQTMPFNISASDKREFAFPYQGTFTLYAPETNTYAITQKTYTIVSA